MYILHFTIYRNFLTSFSHLKMRLIIDGKFLVMVRIFRKQKIACGKIILLQCRING